MSVMEIALACGFQSPPHFSKCYRDLFGHTPSAERRNSRLALLVPDKAPSPVP
jgi:transcriptional regulator GlxA family with amidase domain